MQQNQLELIISLCNSLGSMNDTERLLHDELGVMCSCEAEKPSEIVFEFRRIPANAYGGDTDSLRESR